MSRPNRFPILLGGVGVVLVSALVAVLVTRTTDEPPTSSGQETRPVTVTGTALAPLPDGADPAVGQPAPDLQGATFAGDRLAIAHDGQPKIVFFLAHWCPHCQREVPVISDWLRQRGPLEVVDLYAVATATDRARPNYPPSAWLEREGWTIPTLADDADSTAGAAFGVSSYPFFVVIDGSGNVALRASGELTTADLDALVATATGASGGQAG